MKEELINQIIVALMPYLNTNAPDIKLLLTIAMNDYDIKKAETALTVYEGDINEQIFKKFIAAKIAKGLARRTIEYYTDTIRAFFREVQKPYCDVATDDVRMYLALIIHRDKVTKTTANNHRRNLSSFYGWLQKEGILLKNPMVRIEPLKETKKKKKAYSLLDLEKIRLGCETSREKALVEFLASTWCRASEVREVKLSDIDGYSVLVHGKGDKYRTVFLNERARLALDIYLNDRKDNNPYLFTSVRKDCDVRSGTFAKMMKHKKQKEWYKNPDMVGDGPIPDISMLEDIIRKIGKRAGVENVHPHRFRRTGATLALRQGMPIMTVQKLLGHESIATTQIYLDISDEELGESHRKYVI